MAIAVVGDSVSARVSGANSANLTRNSVGAGNLLVICVSTFNTSGAAATVSDNVNAGNYTQAYTLENPSNGWCQQYYHTNVGSGNTQVTVDPTGSSADIDFTITEISGAALSSVLDTATTTNSGTYDNAAGGTATITTATLAQANNVAVASMTNNGNSNALTPDATFTQVGENENNSSGQCYNAERKLLSSTAAVTATWAIGIAGTGMSTWTCGIGIYKEAAAGTVVTPRRMLTGMGV